MTQPTPSLKQKTQVKQKTDLVQKLVVATGIFCAVVIGLNFVIIFNSGVRELNNILK